eukprot:jgi/Botrbrau1/22381/Bobra.0002s0058.1
MMWLVWRLQFRQIFVSSDKNGDGLLTADEIDPATIQQLDTDMDGKISVPSVDNLHKTRLSVVHRTWCWQYIGHQCWQYIKHGVGKYIGHGVGRTQDTVSGEQLDTVTRRHGVLHSQGSASGESFGLASVKDYMHAQP